MKRFTVAILAILYFTVSSGMVMTVHYCMGKVSSVKVDLMAGKTCNTCGSKETKGCCKTEYKVFKIEDNHKAAYAHYTVNAPVQDLPVATGLFNTPFYQLSEPVAYNSHSPPLLSKQDTYLRNCVFRI